MFVKVLKAALAVGLLVGLCQCDGAGTLFGQSKPKTTPYDFTVTLVMTPDAEAKLKASGDSLLIRSFYYGMATPATMAKADELHRIQLGYQTNGASADTRHFTIIGNSVDPKLFSQVVNGQAYAMVTIVAASKAGFEEDVIECQPLAGPIKYLQDHPQTLTCDKWRA